MSRARTRAKLGWITPYREGLLLALFIDDETAIQRLIAWPDTDLPIDDGLSNLTAGDNYAQIALAFLLRGEPKKRISQIAGKLHASKRKRATAFWAAVEAIVAKEPETFSIHMKACCNIFRKRAFKRGVFPEPDVDGSILWHLARRSKISIPELTERSLELIVR